MTGQAGDSLSKRVESAGKVEDLLKLVDQMEAKVHWAGRKFQIKGSKTDDFVTMNEIWQMARKLEKEDVTAKHEKITELHQKIDQLDKAATAAFAGKSNCVGRAWLAFKRMFFGFDREGLQAEVFAAKLLETWDPKKSFISHLRDNAIAYRNENKGKYLPISYIEAIVKSVPSYEYWNKGSHPTIGFEQHAHNLALAFMGYQDIEEVKPLKDKELVKDLSNEILSLGHLNHEFYETKEKGELNKMDYKQLLILRDFFSTYFKNKKSEIASEENLVEELRDICNLKIKEAEAKMGTNEFLSGLADCLKNQKEEKIDAEKLAQSPAFKNFAKRISDGTTAFDKQLFAALKNAIPIQKFWDKHGEVIAQAIAKCNYPVVNYEKQLPNNPADQKEFSERDEKDRKEHFQNCLKSIMEKPINEAYDFETNHAKFESFIKNIDLNEPSRQDQRVVLGNIFGRGLGVDRNPALAKLCGMDETDVKATGTKS